MIVDLDVLNVGELFEVLRDRARDGVKCAVGLAGAGEVNMCHTIGIFKFAITGETVKHEGESLFTLHTDRTLEVFVEHGADDIAGGWHEARGRNFIRELTADQFIIVGKVDIDLYI